MSRDRTPDERVLFMPRRLLNCLSVRPALLAAALVLIGLPYSANALIKDKQIFAGITMDAGWDAIDRPYSMRWEGGFWIGGDMNKFRLKTSGELHNGHVEEAEMQFLYARRISQFWEVQAGIRYDLKPRGTTFGVLGIEGEAPYGFDVGAALFVDHAGNVSARLEADYDLQVTQRLIVRPFLELNFSASNVERRGVGAGLSDFETGVQIRYEIRRELAPFIEFRYTRLVGRTARFARDEGESDHDYSLLIGIRFSF